MVRARVAATLAATVLAGTLLAACLPGAVASRGALPTTGTVTLTGYGEVSPAQGSQHPVSVVLTAAQARRLAALVAALGAAPQGSCMEDSALYAITATASRGGPVVWRASADVCPGTLRVAGRPGAARSDRSCALMGFVVSLLPRAEAGGTRAYASVCSQRP